MSDDKRMDDLVERVIRTEEKVDMILEKLWKAEGGKYVISAVIAFVISLIGLIVSKL